MVPKSGSPGVPHPGHEREHRQIPAPRGGRTVAGIQHRLNLGRLQWPGKARPPVRDPGNRPVQRAAGQALQVPEPQQRPQRGRQPLRGLRRQPPRLGGQERRDIAGRQRAQARAAIGGVPLGERADQVQVTAGHRRLHAALAQQPGPVLLLQHLRRSRRPRPHRLRRHTQAPQVAQQRAQRPQRQVRGIPGGAACGQIPVRHRAVQRCRSQTRLGQPPAQMRSHLHLQACGRRLEAQPGQLAGQSFRIRRKRTRHADLVHHNHDRVLSTRRREQPHAAHWIMPIPPARAPPPASASIPVSA